MSERMERWAVVVGDVIDDTYPRRSGAIAGAARINGSRIIHLVELRENERIGVDLGLESRPPLIPNDDLRARVEAAIHANDKVEPLGERKRIPLVMGVDPASGKDGAASVSMITWEAHEKVLKERDEALRMRDEIYAATGGTVEEIGS